MCINLMLISILLTVICSSMGHLLKILQYFHSDFYQSHLKVYNCLQWSFAYSFCYLFLQIAILLNIAKWIYFFLVIQTHRNIRLFEINAEICPERIEVNLSASNSSEFTENNNEEKELLSNKEDVQNNKKEQLRKLKKQTNIIYSIVAAIIISLSSIYCFYAAKFYKTRGDGKEK